MRGTMRLINPMFIEEFGARLYWMDTGALKDDDCFWRYYHMLSGERRRKADAYLFKKEKRLSVGAGILLNQGLAAYGLCERETMTAFGKNGKPYLREYPNIHFNLAHSEDMAIAVFAGVETGCDIELVQTGDLELADRFFSPGEAAYIRAQHGKRQRDEAFYRLWTLKESFVKAVGDGLMLPFDAFEIRIRSDKEIKVYQNADRAKYSFREYRLGEYRAAVCFRSGS